MRIRFECRHCGASISASDWDSGRAVDCSACRGVNIVPADQAPALSVGEGAVRDLSIRGDSRSRPHQRNYLLWGFAWSGIAVAVIGVCVGGLFALSRASRDPAGDLALNPFNNPAVRQRVPVATALPAFGAADGVLFASLKDMPVKGQDRATFLEMRRSRPQLGEHPLALAIAKQPSEGLGMPFTFGTDCTSSEQHSRDLGKASVALHRFLDSAQGCGPKPQPATLEQDPRWLKPEQVPSLTQVLMAEDALWRQTLVNMLRKIDGPGATRGLVDRAVFDMDGSVRAAAVAALRDRPKDEYTDRLVSAFRHPWAPAADHAAQAVVALDRTDLAPTLRDMVDQPDPTAPTVKRMGIREVTVQPQLVRVNHLRNCTYCHPTSSSENDFVRGASPDWDQPLPDRNYGGDPHGSFVRADMVYLRQDFSLTMPVGGEDCQNNWPKEQRFDFFVFDRPITSEEAAKFQPAPTYPQREAVRYALTKLERTATK